MKYLFKLVTMQIAALSFATQHLMPPEFGGKWGTECFNTRFSLPTLLCAGYDVKIIYILYNDYNFKINCNIIVIRKNAA